MSHYVVITTGGTIASRTSTGGYAPNDASDKLLHTTLRALSPSSVHIDPFLNILSHAMTPADMANLARRIQQHVEQPDVAGVIVTHGTVVMEESAFLCDLLVSTEKPVVFTGAMLPRLSPGEDGPRNLRDSLIVASAEAARGLGVVVCMDGQVHLARYVRKMDSAALGAFQSPGFGPIGVVHAEFKIHARPARPHIAFREPVTLEPNVDLISVVSGMDDRFVRSSIENHAKGLVVEGFPGKGAATPAIAKALRDGMAGGLIVVLATRSPISAVMPSSGGAAGSATLSQAGVIMGGRLSGPKLRLLLMVLLGEEADHVRIDETIAAISGV